MTTKELMITEIERGLRDLFRSARAMPAEKLEWKPSEHNRSSLELLQECTQSMKWPQMLLSKDGFGGDPGEAYAQALAERASWATVDACESAARGFWEETKGFVNGYPEDDFDRQIELPFAPDLKLSVAEILHAPYWNLTYHLGQINYVQLLYGDTEMH